MTEANISLVIQQLSEDEWKVFPKDNPTKIDYGTTQHEAVKKVAEILAREQVSQMFKKFKLT